MLIFYIALIMVTFWRCKFSGKQFFTESVFSRNVTDSIKGFFIWLVFLSHFSGYATYTSPLDLLGHRISAFLGQLIVACFLFYSGYGVCEAIQKKGNDYIRLLPKNRVLKTLFNFDLAVLIFLVISLFLRNIPDIKTVLLSFIGWESLGNSNWYIFVILVLYIITWISFVFIKNNLPKTVFLITFLTSIFIVFLYFTRWSWWYNTALCYVLGMWISLYKNKILSVVTISNYVWSFCVLSATFIFCVLYYLPLDSISGKILNLLLAPCFCIIIMLVSTKVCISNRILIFCGQYLFELYILQRIPMILLKEWGLSDINIYVYFVLCIVVTILLAIIFRFFAKKMEHFVFRKENRELQKISAKTQ